MNIKILGAGSIGNHLANASRSLGWQVYLCDIDQAALERTKKDIYPQRYGKWDNKINLCLSKDAPVGGFDIIIIGTPPDVHLKLAETALNEKPKAILVEKPFTTPDRTGVKVFYQKANDLGIKIFVGYDHVVGKATEFTEKKLKSKKFGKVNFIDVSFREHWGGIFKAHPWLSGPSDTYLGFWSRGGGSIGEHSHGINLWQHFSHCVGGGRVKSVYSDITYVKNNELNYDESAHLIFETENGLKGRLVQDTLTTPPIKEAIIGCEKGNIIWRSCGHKGYDEVSIDTLNEDENCYNKVVKTRPEDFILELEHISRFINSKETSPLELSRVLETVNIISAAHLSAEKGKKIDIDYSSDMITPNLI